MHMVYLLCDHVKDLLLMHFSLRILPLAGFSRITDKPTLYPLHHILFYHVTSGIYVNKDNIWPRKKNATYSR